MKIQQKLALLLIALFAFSSAYGVERRKFNFNSGWLLYVGEAVGASQEHFDDSAWKPVSLPRAWNEDEAFKLSIAQLSDTIAWYRKHFRLDTIAQRKYFLEVEGVRFGAELWLNGHSLGITENGVMASGYDLTPYLRQGENVIAVRTDNDWRYHERVSGSTFQWNDRNFNANYGGMPKNVFLHVSDLVYQTLPLYSNLGTTGTYIYGTDYDVAGRRVTVHAESQVRNDDARPRSFSFQTTITDADGRQVASFRGDRYTLQPGQTRTVSLSGPLSDAHFWSWGYGYLYTVNTRLVADDGSLIDEVPTRTGFRKTRFGEGKVWLNDRVIVMHGYAQRTSNEWPGVGMSVPAWLSDYSNDLLVKSGGNLVRWMHVCPWKQDVESCDRVGLIQAMPAGDAEKDVQGRRWEQRELLMRDAIIYNRNNPSILFYESGNKGVSSEHMVAMKKIRDLYDPHGGRAIGSREMLNIDEAEYGGEMLYVNKSEHKPYWQMEYYRDEGLRKYWDEYSYPFHKEGDGPLYRGDKAPDYNHNMDVFACGQVERWYDYYLERPGQGRRVNAGGAKIIFSDTNTHYRGEANYRSSGVVDAMRIPKDAFYAMQVMWDGWVTPERDRTYIVGHWNYDASTVKPVYVVSSGDEVELLLNGKSLGRGRQQYRYLFTFDHVAFAPGKLEAVSYRDGREVSRYALETAGEPDHLKVTAIANPEGFKADGADMALVQFEVVDKQGRRCPLDNRMVSFRLDGPGEWLGGLARPQGLVNGAATSTGVNLENGQSGMLDGPQSVSTFDNYIRHTSLPVECGVNRVLVRSTPESGDIRLTMSAEGLQPVTCTLHTEPVAVSGGLSSYLPAFSLKGRLDRGETPSTPSYEERFVSARVKDIEAGSNQADVKNSVDDNETSQWQSDGERDNAWITYTFDRKMQIDEIAIKLTGWRNKMYPLAIYEGKKKVWEGLTYATLGYVHIAIPKPVKSDRLTIKMLGPSQNSSKFGRVKELAGGATGELDRFVTAKGKTELRIVEVDFLQKR